MKIHTRGKMGSISPSQLLRMLVSFLALAGVSAHYSSGQTSRDSSVNALMNRGYEVINQNPTEATSLFRQVVAIDPRNAQALKQLGYLYMNQGKTDSAVVQFSAVQHVAPSDSNRLQIAYLLASSGRDAEARVIFDELRMSQNPEIRQRASDELAASLEAADAGKPKMIPRWWTHAYAAPYYDTRWEALFIQSHLMRGRYLTDDELLSLYGIVMLSADTKSSNSGQASVIYSDNSVVVGAGLRLKPFTGLMLDVQEGLAFDLLGVSDPRGDFRAIATYGTGIYPSFVVHEDVQTPWTPFVDLYSSFGYYSRYDNGIGYGQLKGGFRALEVQQTALNLYGRLDLIVDTEKEYFNNLYEYGVGMRLTPNIDWGLYLDIEYHHGTYIEVSNRATLERMAGGLNAEYNSVRLFVILERMF